MILLRRVTVTFYSLELLRFLFHLLVLFMVCLLLLLLVRLLLPFPVTPSRTTCRSCYRFFPSSSQSSLLATPSSHNSALRYMQDDADDAFLPAVSAIVQRFDQLRIALGTFACSSLGAMLMKDRVSEHSLGASACTGRAPVTACMLGHCPRLPNCTAKLGPPPPLGDRQGLRGRSRPPCSVYAGVARQRDKRIYGRRRT